MGLVSSISPLSTGPRTNPKALSSSTEATPTGSSVYGGFNGSDFRSNF
eukprot:CAMPEP_0197196362 /NCGR_PEP_ID=MMETSP1423-20130617/32319_1 /TAXON_ID=476441 /ORGANISM="Pseudo-nitzschia heimii, Strain UNC1101" /LENGTH=47 /DNA_ID= /DNA_START= /DNA_END= /DNA_ORIENTATION=